MAYNTKLRLINAKMEQPSGTTLTLSGNTVFNVGSDGIPKYSQHPNFTGSTVYNDPQVLVDRQYVDDRVSGEFNEMRFTSDILVSIEEGKTFGRYENGDTIPASGKTPSEVILLAVQEPLDPTVSITLNSTNTNTDFGEETKTVNLNLSYTINSLGAESTSAVLEWRRGTSGGWTELTGANIDVGETGFTGTYLHTIDDSGDRFNTTPAEYRLIVVDSQGATNEQNITFVDNGGTNGGFRRTMVGFAQGTMSITLTPSTLSREKGDLNTLVDSQNNANNQPLNRITQYLVERRIRTNGGAFTSWSTIAGPTAVNPAENLVNIAQVSNNVTADEDRVQYRVIYTYEDGSTGTVTSDEVMFNYPNFATTENITTLTQQLLVNMRTANNVEYTLVTESGENKQKIQISNDWLAIRPLVGIQLFNTFSSQWEYPGVGGTAASSLTLWTTSSVTQTIQGNTVNYTQYEHNTPNRDSVQVRLVF